MIKELFKIICIIFLYILGLYLKNYIYISILIIGLCIYNLKKILESPFEIKVLYLFILQYLYSFLYYFIFDKQLSVYKEYNNFENIYKSGLLTFLFTAIFYIKLGKLYKLRLNCKKYENKLLTFMNIFFFIYFMITGITDFKIGDYRRTIITPKVEYSLLFYIVIFNFSNKKLKKIITLIYFIYAIFLLFVGVRVPAIQIIILIIIYWKPLFLYKEYKKVTFFNKIKKNMNILLILLGIIILKFIEKVRNIDGNLSDRFVQIFKYGQTKVLVNNQTDVIYSTAALIGLIKKNILSIEESIKSILGIFFNIIYINFFKEYVNLPLLVKSYTPIGGGGLISGYLYYLGREPLLIFVAIFLGYIIKKSYNAKNISIYIKIYTILLIVTVFRWYPYGPSALFKISFYGSLWFWVNLKLHKIMIKIKKIRE